MLTDLIAGRVHMTIDNLPASQPHADGGAIRPLAVSTERAGRCCPTCRPSPKPACRATRRRPGSPSAAPAKRRRRSSDKLNASVDKFIKTEDGTARLRKLGADPAGGSPEDMQRFVLAEIDKWGKVAQFAGIKPE